MTVPAVETIRPRIERVLGEMLDGESRRWAAVDPGLVKPIGALRTYVLSGGKRLRPAFCYWAFIGAGGDGSDPVIEAAGAALELLHAAALIHDDIIDASATRHDADTVHVQFAQHPGQSDRFGEAVAIVVGDLALAFSSRLLAGAPPAAAAAFDETRIAVNIGQYLDISAPRDIASPGALERAGRVSRYKTTSYTIEGPLRLGAALAIPDGLDDLGRSLSDFALPLGEAFQLRDDLLGVFGDAAITGKPVGDDLREGKPTLLVSMAAERATASQLRVLQAGLGRADLDEAEVAELLEVITATGAPGEVEARIDRLYESALARLAQVPLAGDAPDALGQLAAFVVGRDH